MSSHRVPMIILTVEQLGKCKSPLSFSGIWCFFSTFVRQEVIEHLIELDAKKDELTQNIPMDIVKCVSPMYVDQWGVLILGNVSEGWTKT